MQIFVSVYLMHHLPPSLNHFSVRLGPANLALSRRRELIAQILRRSLRLADGIFGGGSAAAALASKNPARDLQAAFSS